MLYIKKGFVEVKGVTLENDGVVSFPDAPTERGTKHIMELIDAIENGYETSIAFVVQMDNIKYFTPNYERDKSFCDALYLAKEKGVNIMVYECVVSEDSIKVSKKVSGGIVFSNH